MNNLSSFDPMELIRQAIEKNDLGAKKLLEDLLSEFFQENYKVSVGREERTFKRKGYKRESYTLNFTLDKKYKGPVHFLKEYRSASCGFFGFEYANDPRFTRLIKEVTCKRCKKTAHYLNAVTRKEAEEQRFRDGVDYFMTGVMRGGRLVPEILYGRGEN